MQHEELVREEASELDQKHGESIKDSLIARVRKKSTTGTKSISKKHTNTVKSILLSPHFLQKQCDRVVNRNIQRPP